MKPGPRQYANIIRDRLNQKGEVPARHSRPDCLLMGHVAIDISARAFEFDTRGSTHTV